MNGPQHWGVVGGGVMGVTVALRLAQAGHRVTLYEAAPAIGGLAGAWSLGDVTWDRFYHVTLLSDLATRGFLEELGLADQVQWRQTRTGFYSDGALHSMSNSLEFLRFRPLSLVGKARLAMTILAGSRVKDIARLEDVSVEQWLRRWSGDATFQKIWLPLLRSKLGDAYRETSAAFIAATIHRMYAARRSGMKREMFGYVRGGYARVMEAAAEKLVAEGVVVRTAAPVEEVRSEDGAVTVRHPRGADRVDQVVLTTPSPRVAATCPQMSSEERQRHAEQQYIGVVCASVLLKKPLAGYYVTNITDAGLPYTAVIEMTALVDPAELHGAHLIYLPRYALPSDAIWDEPDESVRERFLAGLERMYPHFCRSDVLRFSVARARQVLPLPELQYSKRLPAIRTTAPGVSVVNSVRIVGGTLNVNETIQLAEHAVAESLLPSAVGPAVTTEPVAVA